MIMNGAWSNKLFLELFALPAPGPIETAVREFPRGKALDALDLARDYLSLVERGEHSGAPGRSHLRAELF